MRQHGSEARDEPDNFDYAFIEAVLWTRGVRGSPTLEQFAYAVAVLADYSAAKSRAAPTPH